MNPARLWRWPLRTAVVLVLLAGPAQSWELTGVVSVLCLTAVALAALAVPLGLLDLRPSRPTPTVTPALEASR